MLSTTISDELMAEKAPIPMSADERCKARKRVAQNLAALEHSLNNIMSFEQFFEALEKRGLMLDQRYFKATSPVAASTRISYNPFSVRLTRRALSDVKAL